MQDDAVVPPGAEGAGDEGVAQPAPHVLHRRSIDVLGTHHHGVHAFGPSVAVGHGHLRLGVGPQPGHLTAAPRFGQAAGQTVAQDQRQGQQLGRLIGGIAEHQALVAGAQVTVPRDAVGDVARLPA